MEQRLRTAYGGDKRGNQRWAPTKLEALESVLAWARAAAVTADWAEYPEHVEAGTRVLRRLREVHARDLEVDVQAIRTAMAKEEASAKGDAFGEALAAELKRTMRGAGGGRGRGYGRGRGTSSTVICLVCGENHTAYTCPKANAKAKEQLQSRGNGSRGGKRQ